ncbi:DUF3040 domain-containing protein [Arcanobacterium haemolyticum]|nr:DUF3040 domain-containing protein [Arcanobacterium haemolyticum]
MPLSEYERKMLEELEAQLAEENPGFADTLRSDNPEPDDAPTSRPVLSIRHLVLGLLVAIVGIGVLVGGIAIEQVILGVLGVVVLFVGFWYIVLGVKPGDAVAAPRKRDRSGPSFMERQAEAWEKRRNDN